MVSKKSWLRAAACGLMERYSFFFPGKQPQPEARLALPPGIRPLTLLVIIPYRSGVKVGLEVVAPMATGTPPVTEPVGPET